MKYSTITTTLTGNNAFDSVAEYRAFAMGISVLAQNYQITESGLASSTVLSHEEKLLSPTTVQDTHIYPSYDDLVSVKQLRHQAIAKADSDLVLAALGWTSTYEHKAIAD